METLVLSLLYTDPRFVLNELERVEKEGNKVVVNNVNRPGFNRGFNMEINSKFQSKALIINFNLVQNKKN